MTEVANSLREIREFFGRKRGDWLCLRGRHHYARVQTIASKPNPWTTTYTNAKCRRCHRYGWQNWMAHKEAA